MNKKLMLRTVKGAEYQLSPVPMPRMPSRSPSDWLKFQGRHVMGTLLPEHEQRRLQAFMAKHKTEALTDGKENYTLAGGMLALCNPSAIQ